MNTAEIVTVIASILCPICTVLIAFLTFRKNTKKDTTEQGQKEGALFTELGYIKSGIDRIDKRTEQLDNKQNEQDKKLATLEVKIDAHIKDKNAHNYKGV